MSVPAVLAGRYLIGSELGSGGAAVVHRAWDTVLRRDVAVKILRGVLLDPAGRERFGQEARLLARLDHPGLVAVYDMALHEDQPYLVMELVDGQSLAGHRYRPRPPTAEVVRIGAAVATTLAHVHDHGVAHRDVKPGNILIAADGRVKLADFGIARVTADEHITATGMIVGTAAYLAPEQVRGEPAGEPADVYALGLVLIELLRGTPVYQGTPDVAALARLTTPPEVDPAWPTPLRALLSAMTRPEPAARPRSAEVAARLEAALTRPFSEAEVPVSSATTAVQPTSALLIGRLLRARRRRRGVVGALLAAALVVPAAVLGGQMLAGPPATGHDGASPTVQRSPAPATTAAEAVVSTTRRDPAPKPRRTTAQGKRPDRAAAVSPAHPGDPGKVKGKAKGKKNDGKKGHGK
jgi:eukaryotic-like serine/threonine-protein kinase